MYAGEAQSDEVSDVRMRVSYYANGIFASLVTYTGDYASDAMFHAAPSQALNQHLLLSNIQICRSPVVR